MQLIRDLSALPDAARGAVVALGNFDGLHEGHRAVLETAKILAREGKAPLAVMTFEPHPRRLFKPELPPLRILPLAEKLRRLRAFGVDVVYMLRFNRAFSQISAERFITDILVKTLAVHGVVTGENFIYGHGRGGDRVSLAAGAEHHGFRYLAVPPVKIRGDTCSSTRLRGALAGGDVELAGALLGHPYAMTGRIVHGDKRGRELGFRTANLRPAHLFHPTFGIYVTRLRLVPEFHPPPLGGRNYIAVSSFGLRPMYAVEEPLLETHLLDAAPELYGKKVAVEFLHYLRPERKFDSEAELSAQIQRDVDLAREWFRQNPSFPGLSGQSIPLSVDYPHKAGNDDLLAAESHT